MYYILIKEGPIYKKISKNDPTFKNEYGFTVYEFYSNSYSAPGNRCLLQILISSEDGREDFKSICQKISDNYIDFCLKEMNDQLKMNEQNDLNVDQVERIAVNTFYHSIDVHDICKLNNENDIIITRNNYYEMDINYYYVFLFNIG